MLFATKVFLVAICHSNIQSQKSMLITQKEKDLLIRYLDAWSFAKWQFCRPVSCLLSTCHITRSPMTHVTLRIWDREQVSWPRILPLPLPSCVTETHEWPYWASPASSQNGTAVPCLLVGLLCRLQDSLRGKWLCLSHQKPSMFVHCSDQFRAGGGTETPRFSDVEEEAKEFKELAWLYTAG